MWVEAKRWQRPGMSNSGGGQYCAELAEASRNESWQRPAGVRAGRSVSWQRPAGVKARAGRE